jgi:hypothetical protein
MARKPTAAADDTLSYLLREIDGETWRRARVRAVIERRDMSEVLRSFIRDYAHDKPAPAAMREARRRK